MRGRLDALARSGGDAVLGDDQIPGPDDDDVVPGVDGDAGADPAGRHRVIALLVTHQRFGAHGAGGAARHLISVEAGARGERFLEQAVARPGLGGRVYPDIGDGAEPVAALGGEVVETVERAAVEEAVAQIGDAALDLTLGPRPIRPAALDLEAVMAGEVEEALVDALGPDDDLAHVVVEDAPGPAAEKREGVLMTANQRGQGHRAGKL